MTKAEQFMSSTLDIILSSEPDEGKEAKPDYIAEFKPGYKNPLQIKSMNFKEEDPYAGNAIFLSYESTVELAKFLKELFLDEVSE